MKYFKEQGRLLRIIRGKLGISQGDMAEVLGYERHSGSAFMSSIERGEAALPIERWKTIRKVVPRETVLAVFLEDQKNRFNKAYDN